MRARLLASFIVVSAVAIQSQAGMMAYLTIKGQKTGVFKGGVTQKGREGKIAVIAADHDLGASSNAGGRPGLIARRSSQPVKLTLLLDQAAPLIYNAMSNGEILTEVTVDFWAPQVKAGLGIGTEVQHYSIKLTNATISDVHFVMPNIMHPDTLKSPETIEVSFTYQKIEWTWKDGGITASDDWKG